MAYVKNIWVDQDVERPKTYEVTNNQDGSITLTDSFGLVTELGTPVNETNMNHIEAGIDGCAIRKHNLTETFVLGEWVLGGSGDDEGLYKSLVANNVGNAITDDTKWEKISMGAARNIGEIVQSTIPLTDAGLHLLDGTLIDGSGSYSEFVDYIADLVTQYPDLFETEANWQQSVSDYGVCGKFVYNSTNNTVRLPKITGFIKGATDITALGDLVEESLPNIKGSFHSRGMENNDVVTGAFSNSSNLAPRLGHNNADANVPIIDFDASRSSSTYQDNAPVQPQAIKVLYYIVIATAKKTSLQIDIDEIATDLNGKADVDLTNVNDSGTSRGAGWAMPSDTYETLTLGSSGTTYTAPASGWFYFDKKATASGQFIELVNRTANFGRQTHSVTQWDNLSVYIPAASGDTVMAGYSANGTTNAFRFIYAQGSESEAN